MPCLMPFTMSRPICANFDSVSLNRPVTCPHRRRMSETMPLHARRGPDLIFCQCAAMMPTGLSLKAADDESPELGDDSS